MNIRTLKFLIQKEFLQASRDRGIIRIVIVIPLILLLVLPWAATFEQRNIQLSLVDNDHSTYSRHLIEKIVASGFFHLSDYSDSYSKALDKVERDEADMILEIPANFESRLKREDISELLVSINSINGQKAGLGANYIIQIIRDFNTDFLGKDNQHTNQVSTSTYYKYNETMNYQFFIVPGILVMLLTIVGGTLSSMNIVREKESGTIEQLNVTPLSRSTLILSKLIPFWIIGLFILTIGLIIARLVYGITPLGSVFHIYLSAFCYLMTFTGLGLVIANYSETQQQAMLVAFMLFLTCFLLSGIFTPVSSMPDWAQTITKFNPVRYFVEIIRLIFMKGSGLSEIMPKLLSIGGFGIVFNLWAVLSYKKTK